MLQNILEYWKLGENLIVNDFDKPYIVLVLASWHLMDTASGLILGRYQLFFIFFCHLLLVGVFTLTSFKKINNYGV